MYLVSDYILVFNMRFLFLIACLFQGILLLAQQNFINVPSSEVTKKNKLFFQQQINFNEQIQSNTTLDFGLGKGFEIGINVLGVNFDNKLKSVIKNDTTDTDPYNPLIMLNGLKHVELSENVVIAFGAQTGLNFNDNKKTREAALVYGNILFKNVLVKQSSIVLGSYYNSLHYGGNGNRVGLWVGTEVPILERLHVMAESVLGYNAISYTSLGIIIYPLKKMPLTFGVQIPNTKNNSYSFVFELTFVP